MSQSSGVDPREGVVYRVVLDGGENARVIFLKMGADRRVQFQDNFNPSSGIQEGRLEAGTVLAVRGLMPWLQECSHIPGVITYIELVYQKMYEECQLCEGIA